MWNKICKTCGRFVSAKGNHKCPKKYRCNSFKCKNCGLFIRKNFICDCKKSVKGKKKSKESIDSMSKKIMKLHEKGHYSHLYTKEMNIKRVNARKKSILKNGYNYAWKDGVPKEVIKKQIETKRKKGILPKLEKNPNWKGGKSFEPYDKNFNNKLKKLIRKRDNQVCMICGIHREKVKVAFDVHHIDYNKLNSFPNNLISLCKSCHTKTNNNRNQWTKFFQLLLSERYGYNYNKEVVLEIK